MIFLLFPILLLSITSLVLVLIISNKKKGASLSIPSKKNNEIKYTYTPSPTSVFIPKEKGTPLVNNRNQVSNISKSQIKSATSSQSSRLNNTEKQNTISR